MKTLIIILTLLFLYSCAMAPTDVELLGLDYGVAPNDHLQVFKSTLESRLKDPDSLKVGTIQAPKKMWSRDLYSGLIAYWVICGTYNAKNGFGAYTGYEIGAVWYRNGSYGLLNLINGEMPGLAAQYQYPCN